LMGQMCSNVRFENSNVGLSNNGTEVTHMSLRNYWAWHGSRK